MSNSLDPNQARHFVQTVCKDYQQLTKVTTSGERVKYEYDSIFEPVHEILIHITCEQLSLRLACTDVQSHQSLHSSHKQSRDIDESSVPTLVP